MVVKKIKDAAGKLKRREEKVTKIASKKHTKQKAFKKFSEITRKFNLITIMLMNYLPS